MILDPDKDPNRWLQAVLLDLLEQNTEESREALKEAIPALVLWLEPGLVDQLFAHWIDRYKDLMAKS